MVNYNKIAKQICKDFEVESVDESDDFISINVISTATKAKCPNCNQESTSVHSFHITKFQDLPINGKTVIFYLKSRLFKCKNPDCEIKRFTENPSHAKAYGALSDRLIKYIEDNCSHMSRRKACAFLKEKGIILHATTVIKYFKKDKNNEEE